MSNGSLIHALQQAFFENSENLGFSLSDVCTDFAVGMPVHAFRWAVPARAGCPLGCCPITAPHMRQLRACATCFRWSASKADIGKVLSVSSCDGPAGDAQVFILASDSETPSKDVAMVCIT